MERTTEYTQTSRTKRLVDPNNRSGLRSSSATLSTLQNGYWTGSNAPARSSLGRRWRVPRERLDDVVARVLTQMERIGRLDDKRPDGSLDTPEHRALAEQIAVRGTVLLAHDGVLPLNDEADVALIGPNIDTAILGGGGSSEVSPFVQSSPVDGMTERAVGDVTVEYGVPPIADLSLFDSPASEDGNKVESDDRSLEDAIEAADTADIAVVFVRDQATEAQDRANLRLLDEQDKLVEAIAEVNERTVVVVNSSGPVEPPWRENIAVIIENWYPGQAHGDAIVSDSQNDLS